MRTDIAIDKLCDIAPIIGNVADGIKKDEDFKKFILEYKGDRKNDLTFIFSILPLLVKKFKNEVFEILSIIEEKNIEEIKAQPFGNTFSQLKDLFKDEDFKSFFSLFTASAKTQEG